MDKFDVEDLIALIRNYNPRTDEKLIRLAYDYGQRMHEGQTRHSGEPYFTHPVAVAAILTEMRLDDATIITALLHDTIEDTRSTWAEVSQLFGREVDDLRLAGGIADHRRASGEARGHQHDMGRADRDLGERIARADQAALGRGRVHIAAVDLHPGAQRLEAFEEEIDRARADGASARQRHPRTALAGEQRADDPEARPHLGDELVRGGHVGDGAAGEMDGAGIGAVLVLASPVHRHIDPVIAENADQLLDIGEMRHVFERQRIAGHERGDHQRQGRVLGAGNRNGADERLAAHNPDSIHKYVPEGAKEACAGKFCPLNRLNFAVQG